MNVNHFIDAETCTGCGKCVDVCPNRIIHRNASGKSTLLEERLWMCFQCGHCMAVCPTKSVHVAGLDYELDFFPLPKTEEEGYTHFSELIASRRAGRCFLDKPVPHEHLEKIVRAIQMAPPGFPPIKTELTVVEDPLIVRNSLPMMISFYENLIRAMKNPISRQFVKHGAGREKYITIKNHLLPLMIERMPDLKNSREDTILRRAPALILFHADRNSENYMADIYIALTYGFLAAHALGLAASAMDLIPPAVEKSRELREYFKIPEKNTVVASMILGYPKHHFQRGIKRELKSVTWLQKEA